MAETIEKRNRDAYREEAAGSASVEFARRRQFPGTDGTTFDVLTHLADRIDALPSVVFAALLFVLALVGSLFTLPLTLVLYTFFMGDWVLLLALSRVGKSFGPAKPATFLLAILRVVPALAASALLRFGIPSGILVWTAVIQMLGTALVAALALSVHGGEVLREAFADPLFVVVAPADRLSPPLVRKLVRDQAVTGTFGVLHRQVQRAVWLDRSRRVFHAAVGEPFSRYLIVFFPWKFYPDGILEERHNVFGVAEA